MNDLTHKPKRMPECPVCHTKKKHRKYLGFLDNKWHEVQDSICCQQIKRIRFKCFIEKVRRDWDTESQFKAR